MFDYMPEQASEIAPKIDWLNNLITDISVFFTVAIVGAMLYFAIRYRRRGGVDHETPQLRGSNLLEFIWTFVPTVISVYIGVMGVLIYAEYREVPADALEINVTGKKWQWNVEYSSGKRSLNEVVVPVDTPVKIVLQSTDVLHSFFVPAMRTKSDAVPGIYTYVSFKPVKTGSYDIFCTEYCGDQHSAMIGKMNVVSRDEYDTWVNDNSEELMALRLTPAERGSKLYNLNCKSCHTLDASRLVGPGFEKLFGRTGELEDGSSYTADENYIKESILNPAARVVKGYSNSMTPFQGVLSDEAIGDLIAFIKTVDGTQQVAVEEEPAEEDSAAAADLTPEQRGEMVYKNNTCIACHSVDGSALVGPTFKGLYGKKGELADGSSYVADDEYITSSIKDPNSQVVKGFAAAMPPLPLSDDQIKDVISFIKTLK